MVCNSLKRHWLRTDSPKTTPTRTILPKTSSRKTKLGIIQTELAYLVPPSLKTKARYMNLESLVSWGQNVLSYLDAPRVVPGITLNQARLEAKLGWLRDYREDLKEWSELLAVAEATEDYIRYEGYHTRARQELWLRLKLRATCAPARRMRSGVLRFVQSQSAAAAPGERLLGSSEVLESLIGTYKRMQSTHSKGGMTAMLLSIGAIVSRKTSETIHAALTAIKSSDVLQWIKEGMGVTLQAQRLFAFREEQKPDTKHSPQFAQI